MRIGGVLAGVVAALALCACAQGPSNQSSTFLDRYAQANPTLASFRECHGFACAEASRVSLSAKDWRRVVAVFHPPARNARAERRQIARGVLQIRRMVGAQTGTAVHQWTHKDMIILPNRGDRTQLDCIDEAVNTWTYMTLMERAVSRLGQEYELKDNQILYNALLPYLGADSADRPPPHKEIASRLSMSEPAVKVAIHRLRKRCRELLREEIAQTLADPDQTDDELRSLFAAVSS